MKKLLSGGFIATALFAATTISGNAADIKQQDIKSTYMRYCMTNGGVREICDCSYTEAQITIEPKELEAVVKTLSAGIPSNDKTMTKMNRAVQDCARKVEKGELVVQRPVPAAPKSITAPVPPAPPVQPGLVPPPPPPPAGTASIPGTEPIAIPVPPAPPAMPSKAAKTGDELSIDYLAETPNPAKEAPKPKKKKVKKAEPKKEEVTYFGQYDDHFFNATIRGDLTGLKAMSQQMKTVDIRDPEGNTPLITSVIYGKDVSMNFLLGKGADVNAKNGKEQNALQLASFIYRPDMVEKLLAAGAKPDESYGQGFTALILAVMKQDEATVAKLLQYKANPKHKMNDGNSALHIAAGGQNMAVLTSLVSYGAEVNSQNDLGYTPLMLAAYNGNVQAVQYLVGYKADPSIRDNAGRNAAQLAMSAGHFQIAQFLASR